MLLLILSLFDEVTICDSAEVKIRVIVTIYCLLS